MRSTGGGRARPKSPAPMRKTPRTRGVDDGDDARLELLREGRVARRDAVLAGDAGQRHGVDALLEIKDRVGRAEAQLEARRGVAQGARRPPREGGADAGRDQSRREQHGHRRVAATKSSRLEAGPPGHMPQPRLQRTRRRSRRRSRSTLSNGTAEDVLTHYSANRMAIARLCGALEGYLARGGGRWHPAARQSTVVTPKARPSPFGKRTLALCGLMPNTGPCSINRRRINGVVLNAAAEVRGRRGSAPRPEIVDLRYARRGAAPRASRCRPSARGPTRTTGAASPSAAASSSRLRRASAPP